MTAPIHTFHALLRPMIVLLALAAPSYAFNSPVDAAGPLVAEIRGPKEIFGVEEPMAVQVHLRNTGDSPLKGTVRLGVIDRWTLDPAEETPFSLEGGAEALLDFAVRPGADSFNALYPVHAWASCTQGEERLEVHPVLIVEVRRPDPPAPDVQTPWKPLEVGDGSTVPLWRAPVFRVVLGKTEGTGLALAPGWSGSEGRTRAYVELGRPVSRGGGREAVVMHPPWQGDLYQSVLVEFPLELPDAAPLTLGFANAIRDHRAEAGEPASDGVTFRVRVVPGDSPDGALGEIVFERHTDAKTWQVGEADLTPWAGRSVRVQLESHPGPQGHTACDESYWGAPTLVAGRPAAAPQAAATPPVDLGTLVCGSVRYGVRVQPGRRGLLDAVVSFVGTDPLSFRGFPVRVLGDDLSQPSSLARLVSVDVEEDTAGHLHLNHRFESAQGPFTLVGELRMGVAGLQARFRLDHPPAPRPWKVAYIEDVSAGSWNRPVQAVYAGTGNVLVKPEAFSLGYDGHRLSTSHVGFDFGGMSMVQAVDLVPGRLDVEPETSRYTLHAPHAVTFTFIPCPSVWEGVKAWRNANGLQPSPGVRALAGRFVFDLWGGRYGESAQALEKAFRYGLTDSVVVWHNWQRWGYDYRLPDIYPPNPDLGTAAEFRALADLCKARGALFAPHDNYIDYYPDAEGYSYDRIAFDASRQPVRGWLNWGRNAQAYQWRPDAVHPVVERNLRLIREGVAPTAYFIDVWASAPPHDYWTHDGRFYDRTFTRNVWGREFAWIRDYLGGAPQISESGHDQLIGRLDGAQANHLRVWRPGEPDPAWMAWQYPCVDAERIPWFDAAHHDRFVLHGAGYEPRYTGGLDARLHGIYSDDYICTEVLTGHPAMVSEPFGRDVVRKYWLLHDLMRALALQPFEGHAFGPDIHRQHVTWEDGETWVNRGSEDWAVAGRVLPPFGFYARAPRSRAAVEAAIERRGDRTVEWSRSPALVYVNARPPAAPRTRVRVSDPAVDYAGDRAFTLHLTWEAPRPLPEGVRPFVHFMSGDTIAFQADYDPPVPASQWTGTVENTVRVDVPARAAAGEAYELRVGLYRPSNLERLPLDGWDDGNRGIRLGSVRLVGDETGIADVEWVPAPADPAEAHVNPPLNGLVDFGVVQTDGACRLTLHADGLYVTPLPDGRPFTAAIVWADLPWRLEAPTAVEATDEKGAPAVAEVPLRFEDGVLRLDCDPAVFTYRVVAAPLPGPAEPGTTGESV